MKQNLYLLSKSLLAKLALVAALLSGGGISAWADELTVNDGTSQQSFAPVYGGNVGSYFVKSEFIIQSSDISDVAGKTITKLTFYLSEKAANSWGDAIFNVVLKEVDDKGYSSSQIFLGEDGSTSVYTGSLDATSETMDIVFTNPFTYTGSKNLLVGIYCTTKGTNAAAKFYGKADYTNYPVLYFATSNSKSATCPKTTITYEADGPAMSISHPSDGDNFGFVQTNSIKTYTLLNVGSGSFSVNIESDNTSFTVSESSIADITNDGTGKTFNVTFNYDANEPGQHSANITITPSYEGGVAQTIEVSAGPDAEFNEDKTTTWTTGSGQSVYVKYTATDGWNTICFPLNLNYYKSNLFGSSATVQLYKLNSYSNGTLTFEKVSYPSSNTPYLVYVENASSSSFIITSTQIGYNSPDKTALSGTDATFQGTFAPMDMEGKYGVTSDGKVMLGASGSNIKGYRAYFTGISAPSNGARPTIVIADSEPTDVGFVKMIDEDATDVFTLSGQKVQKTGKGIYVVNGRKVVIK